LINLFNPQRIILGGKVGLLLGKYCLPDLLLEVERYALKQPFYTSRLLVSQLGVDAVSLGAARQALETFMLQIGKPGDHLSRPMVSPAGFPTRQRS
jgi:hypothetical protein